MVSYRFKRDGQYIQRELELDPLDEHQDKSIRKALKSKQTIQHFTIPTMTVLVKTVSHVNKRKNKVSLRVGKKGYPVSRRM